MSTTDIDRIWILTARKLMGDASQTELTELELLLEKHPDQVQILTRIAENWNETPVKDSEFMEATYLVHLGRMKDQGFNLHNPVTDSPEELPVPAINRFRFPLLSLALLLVLFLGWFVFAKKEPAVSLPLAETKSEISTRNGNRTRIQLPDGSTVWLNAGSKLDYTKEFGNKIREVQLTGEGYFDVVRNPEKPFIIHTASVDVKVLGTQFNVKSYPGDKTTETSLIKGSVEVFVKNRGEKWVLRPNEKLVVENELPRAASVPVEKTNATIKREPLVAIKELTYIQPDAVIPVEASWTRNQLSFKDEPFAEVARKMERWYDVEFEFRNKLPGGLMMYGTFTNETLEQALEALQFSFGFRYEIRDKKVIIN